MEIKGKVHCFFEQSGTFKNEFKKLGYPAFDYDIQNNFGETDFVIDLFSEIEKGYAGEKSIFDTITNDDLIISFFPCIEFSCVSQMWFSLGCNDYRKWENKKKFDYILNKSNNRTIMFNLLCKFCFVCIERGYRMIFENPWGLNTFLKQNVFLKKPSYIDNNRSLRGDFRIKPTAYWYWNCVPTYGFTFQPYEGKIFNHNQLKKSPKAGICSEARSMISTDYARNFICDNILGIKQKPFPGMQLELDLQLDILNIDVKPTR